jgi:putative FmdB family regulatory protein
MPTYNYKCEACKYKFEHFQSIKSEPLKKCPNCGFLMLKRLIGAGSGIIFKGKDWPGQDIVRGIEKNGDL